MIKKLYNACLIYSGLFFYCCISYAGPEISPQSTPSLGAISNSVLIGCAALNQLITAGCYIIGMAFGISAILKFKAHKDSPTQMPISTPIVLVFVSASLIFLPLLCQITGHTIFGPEYQVAGAAGTTTN